jgi:hypothetical protein
MSEPGNALTSSSCPSADHLCNSGQTVGTDAGHTDVSLWFVLAGTRDMPVTIEPTEFTEARWWTHREILDAAPGSFDPHLHYQRFTKDRQLAELTQGSKGVAVTPKVWCGANSTRAISTLPHGASEQFPLPGKLTVTAAQGGDGYSNVPTCEPNAWRQVGRDVGT